MLGLNRFLSKRKSNVCSIEPLHLKHYNQDEWRDLFDRMLLNHVGKQDLCSDYRTFGTVRNNYNTYMFRLSNQIHPGGIQ